MRRYVLIAALAASMAIVPTRSNPTDDLYQLKEAADSPEANGKPGNDSSERPPFPKFDEVTKDMEAQKGLFTLWSYPPDAKDKDKEKLLCQIPSKFLGEQFMLSLSFSGGGFFTGFPLEQRVVKWEVLDKQLLLIEPETRFVVDKKHAVSDVVRRTHPERIRAATRIVTKSPQGDPVIDLGSILKSNFANISWMFRPWMSRQSGGSVNPILSKWTKKKTFEMNVEIGVALAVRSASPPGSYEKKLVHYSFWKLPSNNYKPRVADDRIGYYVTAQQDWTKPTDARELFNRYIDRWHLEKRDPKLSLCEPKKPIVYYVEKTVPVRFRRAVRDGILEWNKAYEKIGIVNAIEVRQQTDDNEWRDLDPEDMRYSFFRWIVSGFSFAMGPHRSNPFTGQIYDADIIFDDSMVRFMERQAQRLLPSALSGVTRQDPVLRDFLNKYPQWRRPTREWESFVFGQGVETAQRERLLEHMRHRGHLGCGYAEGMKHQLGVAYSALAGQPREVIDRFLYDVVKEIVMHEVGHTLGLRHNFKGSSIYTLDEIKKRRAAGDATTGSVMDYNPVLIFAENTIDGHFITPTLGPYDYWAIEYGYRPSDDTYKFKEKAGSDEEPTENSEEKSRQAASANHHQGGWKDIPSEVLDQLPPEARKLLETTAAGHSGAEEKPDKPAKKSSAPSFKGPNAGELKMLHAIASRAAEPQLAYASDEDTTILGPDPRSNRFDMGADPIEWAQTRFELVNKRLSSILEWSVKDRESWYHLRRTFVRLMLEKSFVLDYVGRYIGGQHTNRSHRGDPDAPPPFTLVDAKKQRDALTFVIQHLYQDEFFAVAPEVLNHLAVPRWWHAGTRIDFAVDFPMHNLVGALQWRNLLFKLFPNTLRRIHDAELKTMAGDKFTVAEYLQRVQAGCWSDSIDKARLEKGSWSNASPFVSSIRRSLQREYLKLMEVLVRIPPGEIISADLHAMLQYSLRQLNGQIGTLLNTGKLDFASSAHLSSCTSRIERMLVPDLNEYGRRG